MKILLVTIHVEKTPPAFPLAAAVMKETIAVAGKIKKQDIHILNYYKPADPKALAIELMTMNADYIGFSAYTWNSKEILEAARIIKTETPETVIFTGGPQATAAPEIFSENGLFDFIIRGEAESIIEQVLESKPPKGEIISAPIFKGFSDAGTPYLNTVPLEEFSGILWEVSRGCPYNCAFCYESGGSKQIRTISDTRIKEDLLLFRKSGVQKIWVLDPTFNYSSKHAEKVLEMIKKIYPEAHYTFEIRAELMNEKLCSLFQGIDASLQIGLQSINPEALALVNRNLNKSRFLKSCRMMSSYGLRFGIDLIYGLPADNYKSFMESVDFAVRAQPNNIDIFPLSVLPGTELYKKAGALGLKHSGFPDYTLIENPDFSKNDMAKAAALTESCDRIYNIEQSFAWFKAASEAISMRPSEIFENYRHHKNREPIDYIKEEFIKAGKADFLMLIESFIAWSRTAEQAFLNPGREYIVKLCRRPEILDEISVCGFEKFIRRYPSGKLKNYRLYFDQDQLLIK